MASIEKDWPDLICNRLTPMICSHCTGVVWNTSVQVDGPRLYDFKSWSHLSCNENMGSTWVPHGLYLNPGDEIDQGKQHHLAFTLLFFSKSKPADTRIHRLRRSVFVQIALKVSKRDTWWIWKSWDSGEAFRIVPPLSIHSVSQGTRNFVKDSLKRWENLDFNGFNGFRGLGPVVICQALSRSWRTDWGGDRSRLAASVFVPKITEYLAIAEMLRGEYGAESRICRWIACFIFMLSNLVWSQSWAAAAHSEAMCFVITPCFALCTTSSGIQEELILIYRMACLYPGQHEVGWRIRPEALKPWMWNLFVWLSFLHKLRCLELEGSKPSRKIKDPLDIRKGKCYDSRSTGFN